MKIQPTGKSTFASRTSPSTDQSLQKSFYLAHPDKIEFKKISSPSENKKYANAQPNARQNSVAKQTPEPLTVKRFNYSVDRRPACNTGLAKVAVQCSADTFVVNQSLVLRINICGENRHLRQARKRYLHAIKTQQMKNIFFIFTICFTFISCGKKDSFSKNFDPDLLKVVENYQKEYPIPDRKWIKENTPFLNPKYCYFIAFEKSKNDTVFWIQLLNNGIFDTQDKFGIYEDKTHKPTIVFDDNNLSDKILKKIKNNKLDTFVVNNGMINDVMYPHIFYKVKNKKIIFQKKFRGNME